jgi:hypothetical protein
MEPNQLPAPEWTLRMAIFILQRKKETAAIQIAF